MLQVNLIPDGRSKKRHGGGFSLSLPTFSRMPDRWVLGALVAVLGAVGVGGSLWYSSQDRRAEVEVALERAVQDSSRFADLISRTSALTARRDSIFEKVGIIQEIDRDRFVWPHILDEVVAHVTVGLHADVEARVPGQGLHHVDEEALLHGCLGVAGGGLDVGLTGAHADVHFDLGFPGLSLQRAHDAFL